MDKQSLLFEDVNIGDTIPSLKKEIKLVNLVMYQGATWDFHRYHYDLEFVREKGFDKPFLDGQMLGAYLGQLLTDWVGSEGFIKKLGFRFTSFVFPGDVLNCKGEVTDKKANGDSGLIECRLWIENQKENRVLDGGTAQVVVPMNV